MAANLIGSVAIGFGAVLMGTVVGRALELPTVSTAATAADRHGKAAAKASIRFRTEGDGTNSESADGMEGATGDRVHDGGKQ
jgi:hypothetical protein